MGDGLLPGVDYDSPGTAVLMDFRKEGWQLVICIPVGLVTYRLKVAHDDDGVLLCDDVRRLQFPLARYIGQRA